MKKLSYLPVQCLLSLPHFKHNHKVVTNFIKNREKMNLPVIPSGRNRAVSCGRAE
jgi:hypothetical protein